MLAVLGAAVALVGRGPAPAAGERAAVDTAAGDPAAEARVAIELPPGTELRTAPAWDAPVIAVSAGGTAQRTGEPFDGWIEILQGDDAGWVRLGPAESWPDGGPVVLSRARRLLGAAAAEDRRLGPFTAASDLPGDDALWRFLDGVAASAVELWSERYGLDPGEIAGAGPAGADLAMPETVVLFASEADYRAAAPAEGAGLAGHAGAGFTLLWAGERSRDELAATLIHELTHLLNRRAFGYAVPAWLDEGMAEDLALARPDRRGRLHDAPLTRRSIHAGNRMDLYGPLVQLPALLGAADSGRLPPFAEMIALEREALLASPDRPRLYAYYGLFVRYLIEGESGGLRPGFRTFLARAAAGGDPAPTALAGALGRDVMELETGYEGWLRGLPRRLRLPVSG